MPRKLAQYNFSPPGRSVSAPARLVLAGLALAIPLHAADRAWNSDFGAWSEANKWSPNGLPGVADRVFVGTTAASLNGVLNMDVNATIAELEVRGRSDLDTEGMRLTVNGPVRVIGNDTDGVSSLYARLHVMDGAAATDFRAASLQLTEGRIVLIDDPSVVIDGNVSVGVQAEFLGGGFATVGGNFTNSGLIEVFGNDMTINVADGWIDLDGAGEGEIVINPSNASDLYIVADSITDAFDGRVFIGGGSTLAVITGDGWELGPDSLLQTPWWQSENYESEIWGSPLTVGGNIKLYGTDNTLRIEAPTTFTSTALVNTYEGACLLELNAASTVNGGYFDISPSGTSVQFNHVTTINGGEFELDEDSALSFNGTTEITGGEFSTFSNLAADGAVLFNGSTEWRGTVNIDGVARQVGNATVTGQTVIHADVFDMDGGGANWTINHGLVINAQAIDELTLPNAFNTQMTIGGSLFSRLTVNLSAPVYWQMLGQMTIVGDPTLYPTRVAGSTMFHGGDLTLSSGRAHIASDLIVASTSTTTIPAGATLRVGGATQIYSNATFVGGGTLRNSPTGNLNLYNGAALDQVGIVNDGVFYASLFPAVASVGRFENAAGGTWSVNVVGPAAGSDHDLLIVSDGPATLGGVLRVRHYDIGRPAFRPEVGDEYTILTALDGVSGAFSSIPRSFSQGLGFDWTAEYGTNDLTLRVATINECPLGDLDDDGDIDIADLAILLANFGTASGAEWPDGDVDADGAVTLTDLAILLSNFGMSCA